MQYRMLGRTGLRVSEIGFGTWGIGGTAYGPADDSESRRCLMAAFEKGVNFYDTADLYGDGHAERLLGEVLGDMRGDLVIATKGGTLPHTTFDMPQDFSGVHMRQALNASLERLKTDHVDVYFLHSPQMSNLEGNDELFGTLESLRRQGLVRHVGLSARSPQDALLGIEKFDFEVVEVNLNIIDHRAIDCGLLELARRRNVGVVARTPLAFGYLSGALTGNESLAPQDHRANWPASQLQRWAQAPGRFTFLTDGTRRTPAQAALSFCLGFDEVSTVIPGMMRLAEVEEDVATSGGVTPLSRKEIDRVREVYAAFEAEFYDKNFVKVPK